jgi:hypothetical protein
MIEPILVALTCAEFIIMCLLAVGVTYLYTRVKHLERMLEDCIGKLG